jgi:hypothetical protein
MNQDGTNPKNQKTFVLEYTCEDGEVLEGQFTTKRLSVKDRSKVGVRKSQLSGGMYCVRNDDGDATGQGLDEDTDYMNSMIAHLEVALIQKPTWWDLDKLTDLGLVREVYEKVVNFEMTFFRTNNSKANSGGVGSVGAGNSSPEPQGDGTGNRPTEVVGQEVQAALDA